MARADRRTRLQLVLGGLRWRAGASLSMFLVATAAIAAGTFGPVYLTEADHSVLLSTLASAPVGNAGLSLIPSPGPSPRLRLRHATAAESRNFGGRSFFGPPVVTEDLSVTTTASNGQRFASDLVARTDACRHLSFSAGHCPTAAGSVALTTRSAHALGIHDGEHLALVVPKSHRLAMLSVSGIFRPGDAANPVWWGQNFFPYGFGSTTLPLLDDLFASPATILAAAPSSQVSFVAEQPLHTAMLTPGAVSSFDHSLSVFTQHVRSDDRVGAGSDVTTLFRQANQAEHTTNTIVTVIDLQLVLLSLLILYFVAARTAEVREPDVRLAELRGFGRANTAAVALLEPLVVLGLSVPVGLAVAWLAARLVTPHLFVTGVGPGFGFLAVGAALLSFAAGLVSTIFGARRLVLRRGAGSDPRASRSLAVAVDAVAVTLAGAAFAEVAAGGVASGSHTDPLAAFAPGLLAFGIGVLFARILPLAARLGVAVTRNSRWVAATVAVRRVSRRAELSRHVVVMTLAIGLAVFAIAGWSVAGHNRTLQADFDVGADRVLTVQPRPGVNLLTAVSQADPRGKKAMAAVIERAPDGVLLAVDASRLADVSSWPSTVSTKNVQSISQLITPRTAPTVTVAGRTLRVSVDVARSVDPPPQLEAVVFDDAFQTLTTLDLGSLEVSQHTYQASLAGACTGPCRLVNLALAWTPPDVAPTATISFPLVVTALADQTTGGTWSAVSAGLRHRADWVGGQGGPDVSATRSGLAVTATVDADGAPVIFSPDDVPHALPAVVTGTGAMAVGLDGATIAVKAVATVNALPVVGNGNGAALVDLPLAERLQSGPMLHTTDEVWLAPGAGGDIERRLQAEGVTVVAVHTAASRAAVLSKSGVSLAYDLFLLAALAAAVLAVGATIFVVSVTARRRIVELASLRAVGIAPRSLRRSLALEQTMVLGLGLAAGAGAGILAAAVALRSIPENFASGFGAPLAFGLPLGVLVIGLLIVALALAVIVTVAGRVVVGRASAEKLGGEQ